jgi:hypothetical protein
VPAAHVLKNFNCRFAVTELRHIGPTDASAEVTCHIRRQLGVGVTGKDHEPFGGTAFII